MPLTLENGEYEGWALLTTAFAKEMGITIDRVHEQAMKNLRERTSSHNFVEICERIGAEVSEEDALLFGGAQITYLVVDESNWGAATILDDQLLHSLANENLSDLYVVPSNKYEAIVTPVMGADDNTIRWIHGSVQAMEVDANDRLSDQVFRYKREGNTLEIVGGCKNDAENRYQY